MTSILLGLNTVTAKGEQMNNESNNQLIRIGIFYDGNWFSHASNYYAYYHNIRSRISVAGLHGFIKDYVAKKENTDSRYCTIVDSHYFRGRLAAVEAQDKGMLFGERQFDDVLVREGITTHYLQANDRETGIDVWFALEAYEQSLYKKFNVCVLVAGDGDYVPLARKLNTLGIRVMVIGFDFKYRDRGGNLRVTATSKWLLSEVSYPVTLTDQIEDWIKTNSSWVSMNDDLPIDQRIFVARKNHDNADEEDTD